MIKMKIEDGLTIVTFKICAGYEEGGVLTESIRRRPYQVLLLDEFEKVNKLSRSLVFFTVWNQYSTFKNYFSLYSGAQRCLEPSSSIIRRGAPI